MPNGLLPLAPSSGSLDHDDPQAVTEAFLAAMADGDVEAATALVDDDIVYVNVGLRPFLGRRAVEQVLRLLDRPGAGFEVYLHSIAVDGDKVLTERTDVLIFGRLRIQFWVWGRFDVRDGRIVLWRDSFDFLDITKGVVRGLVALALPSVQTGPPEPSAPPGR